MGVYMISNGQSHASAFVVIGLACGLWVARAVYAADDVPARSHGGQTLIIPDAQSRLGEIYHVQPGEDAQVTFSSAAPLGRVAGLCTRVVGYVVAPFELEGASAPLLAGAFRLPLGSLDTGDRGRNELLRSAAWLEAAKFPEVTFTLAQVTGVQQAEQTKESTTYTLTLVGPLTVHGVSRTIEVPAKVTFTPSSGRLIRLMLLGDWVTIRCNLAFKLSDFEVGKKDRSLSIRVGDEVKVDIFLALTTISPESANTQGPNADMDRLMKIQRFVTLLRDLGQADEAYTYAETLLRDARDNAPTLDAFASAVADYPQAPRPALKLGLRAARRAVELTKEADPALLATAARVLHELPDLPAATDTLRKAAARLDHAPAEVAGLVNGLLKQYEAEAAAEAPASQPAAADGVVP
jgi:polyisoprenoid-binding protein YceI